jgi:hypothetical protein
MNECPRAQAGEVGKDKHGEGEKLKQQKGGEQSPLLFSYPPSTCILSHTVITVVIILSLPNTLFSMFATPLVTK